MPFGQLIDCRPLARCHPVHGGILTGHMGPGSMHWTPTEAAGLLLRRCARQGELDINYGSTLTGELDTSKGIVSSSLTRPMWVVAAAGSKSL